MGIPTGLSVAVAAAEELIGAVIFQSRYIGPYVADATVEEIGIDELEVTEQPVEQGAAITDHSYKRPARLRIRAGWTNSSLEAFGNPARVSEVYAEFLALQAARQPISVMTGKRLYTDMLITSLSQTTNKDWENALLMDIELKQVILVGTQTVTLPPAGSQASPEITAPPTQAGAQSLTPASNLNNSALPADIPSITVDTFNPNLQ